MLRAAGGLIMGVAFAIGFLATLGMDGSLHYPLAYSQVLIAAIALLLLTSAANDWRTARAGAGGVGTPAVVPDTAGGPVVLWVTIALCTAYVASWTLVGFFPATFVYVAVQLWLLRQRSWGILFGVPATVTLLVYVVFARLLTLPFPVGAWFGG
ncbi:tripartite tricarboxylate transporter TctB family protein [Acidisphaera sp. S103]|uniref:tripartite tricarboxylate transporter TctB family protein n=1 Tax=Acidisphaera sp. S103 TaxID=1747223 RepID=UPI00131BA366|nr:tripartite tricarboxylate transporter TctB family protein [Acidisphaera sp. S103]